MKNLKIKGISKEEYFRQYSYNQNNKCQCGNLICNVSIRCKSCSNNYRKGKYIKKLTGKAKKEQGFAYLKKFNVERYWELTFKANTKRPTNLELKLSKLLNNNFPNEWKYSGDGSFWIGFKNPDFININGKKICIEVFDQYYKNKNYGSLDNYKKIRGNHFDKYGWKTIFIESDEFKNESNIIKKVVQS